MARKPKTPRKPGRPKNPKPARKSKGFGEVQGQFSPSALAAQAVFAAYGYACAFTGTPLKAEAAADPRAYLLNLTNDPHATDPTMLIPATLDAIFAFERGHLTIGPNYSFLVDLQHIDPEFLERLNPIGRLRLPADSALAPSAAGLTPHLIAFATGRRQKH